jgi:putative nucleotidyltransferase with HDIG domain
MHPNRKQLPGYGHGSAEATPSITGEDVLARVSAAMATPGYELPVLPDTAIKLVELTRRQDSEVMHVVRLMEQDPLIAAKVLAVAQSAFFSRGARVTSLRDAVTRLGMEELGLLFFEITASVRIFRAPGFDRHMGSLRRHSSMTAQLARLVCRQTAVMDEYAFMCALLHDVGVAAGAAAIGKSVPAEIAWPAILEVHEQIGALLTQAWKLPSDISLIVRNHHTFRINGFAHPVACAIAVAEWLATEQGFALEGESTDTRPEAEMSLLGISPVMVESLRADASALAQRMR